MTNFATHMRRHRPADLLSSHSSPSRITSIVYMPRLLTWLPKSLKIKHVSHVLARIRRIAAFSHRSAFAANLLKSKAELSNLPHLKLKIDDMICSLNIPAENAKYISICNKYNIAALTLAENNTQTKA